MPAEQLAGGDRAGNARRGPPELPLLDRYDFGPVVDGARSAAAARATRAAPAISDDIPLLIGDTKDEATRFLADDDAVWNRTLTEAELLQRGSRQSAGGTADRLFDLYRTRDPQASLGRVADRGLDARCSSGSASALLAERKAAPQAPVYMYSLAWETPARSTGGSRRRTRSTCPSCSTIPR